MARPPSLRTAGPQRAGRGVGVRRALQGRGPRAPSVAAGSTSPGRADPRASKRSPSGDAGGASKIACMPSSRGRGRLALRASAPARGQRAPRQGWTAPPRPRADLQVEQRADHLALAVLQQHVVADGAVGGVLGRSIELDPRVEARLLQRLEESAGRRVDIGDLAGQVLEVLVHRAPRLERREDAPVVIAGRSLEPPEQARVALLAVAIRGETRGPDALDVPRVECLVRDQ